MKRLENLIALAALVTLFASACTKVPSSSDCEKLLKHLIALELKEQTDKAPNAEKVRAALTPASLKHCQKNLSYKKFQCAMAAKSLAEATACDK